MALLTLAFAAGCASGEAAPDGGVGSVFADGGGRVPAPAPGTPDAAPKIPQPDAAVEVNPPDAAVLPDAAPAPDAAPGCVEQQQQLLVNADFDLGQGAGWSESSGLGVAIVTDQFSAPHSGTHVAWLGGYDSGTDIVYQDVDVPAGATALQVAGQIAVGTQELNLLPWDYGALEIRTTTGALLETVNTWSNMDSSTTWQSFLFQTTGDYQGQTIRIYFRSQTDDSNMTNFVFDSLAVRATVCL